MHVEMTNAKKLTRPQRLRLIDAETRAWVGKLDDERLLGLHDLIHDIMDERGRAEHERIKAGEHVPRHETTAGREALSREKAS